MKIQKEEQEEITKNVEGYIDEKRHCFVVTKDNYGLSETIEKPTEKEFQDVSELLKKYKPNF